MDDDVGALVMRDVDEWPGASVEPNDSCHLAERDPNVGKAVKGVAPLMRTELASPGGRGPLVAELDLLDWRSGGDTCGVAVCRDTLGVALCLVASTEHRSRAFETLAAVASLHPQALP